MAIASLVLLAAVSCSPGRALATGGDRADLVWSRDPDTGEEGLHRVTRTFVRSAPVMELEVLDDDATDVFVVTGEHPFWRRDHASGGWVRAQDLLPGDEVFTSRGGWARVGAGTWLSREQLVYNFEVEGSHTYFVGETGTWVHNACFGSGTGPHFAGFRTVDAAGNTRVVGNAVSGRMTAVERILGFPRSTLATHTEARIVSASPLGPGETMYIEGSLAPCPACRGAMNGATRAAEGSTIHYSWPGGSWSSSGGRRAP